MGQEVTLCRRVAPGAALVLALSLVAHEAPSAEPQAADTDLMELSIEELMKVKITSVSRKAEPLERAAAAVYVLTGDDLRRMGVTSLAEALRAVPGVQVSRINASNWGIGVRGFNAGLSNKLLVLIDGRDVYSPLFSGVFWDMQDVLLEDVERIEVIRGPGGTLWGANAVNGVINVITKSARDTQGTLLSAGAGSEELGFGAVRHGAGVGEAGHVRVFSKYFDRDQGGRRGGFEDDWRRGHAGFRSDWEAGASDALTVQGDVYRGEVRARAGIPVLSPPSTRVVDTDTDRGGGNLLARWTRSLGDRSDASVRLYYDGTRYDFVTLEEDRDTYDLDFQHRFPFLERHDLVWGLGYRLTSDDIESTLAVALQPERRRSQVLSGFAQDEISFLRDRLRLIFGTKLERNDFTHWELQPTARVSFVPAERHSLWAAVSRAVRTPTRLEDDLLITGAPMSAPCGPDPALPCVFATTGSRSFDSEVLVAIEGGYRVRPADELGLDLAAFFNDYEDLLSAESTMEFRMGTSPEPHNVIVVRELGNRVEAHAWGGELGAWWRPLPGWRLQAHYTFLRTTFDPDARSASVGSKAQALQSPRHQAFLRSSWDLPHRLEVDAMLRYVDHVRGLGAESYVEVDLRLGWRPHQRLELSLVGQNLVEAMHLENASTNATWVQRGVYGQVRWWFD